ncbi:hypothetical protein V1292_005130 [Bradyrhizobium sp. AZCC 1719]|uniref:hypothetical protein n=1 Tax=Bradyrhizobium sp. AZCC 1719 TaxID=3117028 RepID=UPI002FF3EA95
MTDSFLKKTRVQVRNQFGVETDPERLANVFAVYDQKQRAQMLTDWDIERERDGGGYEGDNSRETAENFGLRARMEAIHQALMKAGR